MAYWVVMLILGGALVVLSGVFFVWGHLERRANIETLARNETNQDVKDLLDEGRISLGPASLKIGGWLFLCIGLVLLILGIVFGTTG